MPESLTDTVLIVDDAPENILLLRDALKPYYRILVAKNGETALKIAGSAVKPDLILLDIVMPGMDGYEVCRHLKANVSTADIPIIFISALDKIRDKAKGFELGAVDYITKPFETVELLSRVNTHIQLKKHHDQLENLVTQRTAMLTDANRNLRNEIDGHIRTLSALQRVEAGYRSFAQIGFALMAEPNVRTLLDMILEKARELSAADAGTLYLVEEDGQQLRFAIMHNTTFNIRLGAIRDDEITAPPVPLYVDGEPNYKNVSSFAALTGEIVNIEDVYEAEGYDFTGPKKYDASTGYRTKSMLVIPMKNHEGAIIGVLQLINAKEPVEGGTTSFSSVSVDLVTSLAAQAAVALTNARLTKNLRDIFYAFIESIATAIDKKSPYTGGHVGRVVELTMMIAETINETEGGKFSEIRFTEDQLEELRLAAWMHDVGKITTPEYVMDKATKLQTIVDRIGHIETRFMLIEQCLTNDYLKHQAAKSSCGQNEPEQLELMHSIEILRQDFAFVTSCNCPDEFMKADRIERIREIAARTYRIDDKTFPYLTEDEVNNLCIPKGSLTDDERKVIENHSYMTEQMLLQIPFPKKLEKVPEYAAGHHERLDGTGYHLRLDQNKLPVQSRIIAIADIFEALTAQDRPYRSPIKLSQAIKIMGFMKKDKHIDPDIFDLFMERNLHVRYAKERMMPEQID